MRMSYPSSSKRVANNFETSAELRALTARPYERLVSRPSVKPIRADDVCAALRFPDLCSGSLREIPIAIPPRSARFGIYVPAHRAGQHDLDFCKSSSCCH
jgi:hypothetical protein